MVRFAPVPPNVILAFGTSVVLLEVAVTVKFAAGVSASPTVKLISPVAVLIGVDWFGISAELRLQV